MGKKLETLKNSIKPKTRKGLILGLIFGVITPIIGGVAAGIILYKFVLIETTNTDGVDITDYRVDVTDKAMAKYNSTSKNADYTTLFEADEIFAIAFKLYSSYENSYSISIGNTDAGGMDQTIRAANIKNGNRYLEESLSKSALVGVANRTVLEPDGSVKLFKGSAVSTVVGNYVPEYYEFTSEEYASKYGKVPSRPLIYIVNQKTIIKDSVKIKKNATGYEVSLSLDTYYGVFDYMNQMKNISGLSGAPKFSYCRLKLTTDKELLAKTLHIEEGYTAKLGLFGSYCDAVLDINYHANEKYTIPEIDTPISYEEGK